MTESSSEFRELGVAIVSTGPGTANAVNGRYEAGFASSTVLPMTTQVDRQWGSVLAGAGRRLDNDTTQPLGNGALLVAHMVAHRIGQPESKPRTESP